MCGICGIAMADGARTPGRDLLERMAETLRHRGPDGAGYLAAPGIGLAAPQVDVGKRLIVVDLSVGEDPASLFVLVNPELISQEGVVVCEEGCLSVPDVHEKVARPYKVVVRGLDLEGKVMDVEGEDLLARVLCHEIDHLEGRLFIERLSPLKRALIRKKFRKQQTKSRPL